MTEEQNIEVKKSYASEVRRALVVLGFSDQERSDTLDTFSRWVDTLERTPHDEEAKATWTEFCLRLASTGNGTLGGMLKDADAFITEQLRRFPPRPRTGLDDGPGLERNMIDLERHEDVVNVAVLAEKTRWQVATGYASSSEIASELDRLREWETTAKQRGWNHPMDMRGHSALDTQEERQRWQDATKCSSPDEFTTNMAEWSKESGCASPRFATLELDRLRQDATDWQSETGCMTPTGAGELVRQLRECAEKYDSIMKAANEIEATGCESLSDVAQWIDTAKKESWQTEALTCAMTLTEVRKTLEKKFPHLGSFANIPWAEFGKKAVSAIESAIVPLPKPERVEVGQRWAVMTNVGYIYGSRTDDHAVDLSEFGSGSDKRMIASGNWIYLGK